MIVLGQPDTYRFEGFVATGLFKREDFQLCVCVGEGYVCVCGGGVCVCALYYKAIGSKTRHFHITPSRPHQTEVSGNIDSEVSLGA